ncbi:Pr6Pr family membrane protein [Qipengyuania sp. XHP0207]|uniref:Pr6Pr family membrane protein n=1 Tax=Qipengyuania sp. XHP0207 TaxID=3038078 RepID=UPI00241C860D|nr:Pr6Pr family membrane protein [Qipengyuania sp. XHP0207]MDG5746661.1 Pr6Pr family membrane protein [Qipengyuania sp. XHP0207]
MDQLSSPLARPAATIIAVAALGALALQTTLNLERDGSPVVSAGLLLRFFTIWGNLAAGLVMAWIALGRRVAPEIVHALATALAIVGLVYWLLLAGMHHPEGLDRITNQFHHTLVPLVTIVWWLAFGQRSAKAMHSVGVVMIAPVAYAVFALAYGAASGFYAYFFLDAGQLGWAQLAINIGGLAMLFALVGALLLGVKRAINARV